MVIEVRIVITTGEVGAVTGRTMEPSEMLENL